MQQIPNPPRWADRFLKWFVDENLLEEIQGDLHEAYYHRAEAEGLSNAKLHFVEDVFRFFRPYAFEKYSNAKQFLPMFNNYFKIALRNILHRKQFTAINFVGLSVGISAVLLIGLYLQNEWTYDRSTADHELVYRMGMHMRNQLYAVAPFENYNGTEAAGQVRMVNYLRELDAVEHAACIVPSQSGVNGMERAFVQANNQEFVQKGFHFTNTGKDFLAIFPQQFLMGSADGSFNDFQEVLLTESVAQRYYGENWKVRLELGQYLKYDSLNYEIVGVIANPPNNVHYDFDLILHVPQVPGWGAYTYLKTKPNASISTIQAAANRDVDIFLPGYSENKLFKGLTTVALTDIHFTKDHLYELKPSANEAYLNIFALIAFVILLIIWTNYTNLSIAMYADRQKELGMRKVLGARGLDITLQLIIEAILLTLLCLPIVWTTLY
ncbi:MAG: permease prefix domain 2-containing transporter [Saprospiraceae bacterium]